MPFVHWKCDFYQVGDAIKNHFIYWARQGRRKGPQLVIIPRLLSERWLIIPNSQKMLVFFTFVTLAFVLSTSEGNTLNTFLTKVEKLNLLGEKNSLTFVHAIRNDPFKISCVHLFEVLLKICKKPDEDSLSLCVCVFLILTCSKEVKRISAKIF